MANALATETDAGTPAGPDRSIPQELIDLALLAIKRGAQSVSLGYEGLGYDFPAPIGWLLWIHRFEHGVDDAADGTHTMLTHQVGCALDDILPPAWLATAAADGTPDATVIDGHLELFEAGVKNGWGMTYTRQFRQHEVWTRTCARSGMQDTIGLQHVLKGNAPNWSRTPDSTAPTSVELSLAVHEKQPTKAVAGVIADEYSVISRSSFESSLHTRAPGFARVAYADDELEEWVL